MKNATYAEVVTDNKPLCLSSASGEGSRPRNSTKTWTFQNKESQVQEDGNN
jgi:hypothetical protein